METDEAVDVLGGIAIDDHTATLINRMAKKFYSKPENVKKFEEWHLKIYGCLPNGRKKDGE